MTKKVKKTKDKVKPVAKKVAVEKKQIKKVKKAKVKKTRVKADRVNKLKKIVSVVTVIVLILLVMFGVQWLLNRPAPVKKTEKPKDDKPLVVEKEDKKDEDEKEKEVVTKDGTYDNEKYEGYSLVEGLENVTSDTSYFYRVLIANENGIKDYVGSADQNIELLDLLKTNKLKAPKLEKTYAKSNYVGNSIVDALDLADVDSSFYNRAVIAAANGVKNYVGSGEQNTQLLNLLQEGKLKQVNL